MSDAATPHDHRWLAAACLVAVGVALAVFVIRSVGERLWLDELLTLTLLQAHSLPKLWSGIALGIDANPPIYLTLAWLLSHALPASVPVAVALKLANIAITVAALVTLYRIGLRIVSPLAAWAGTFMLVAVNTSVIFFALEIRTYAIYLLFGALAILSHQRLMEQGRSRDIAALAAVNVALALSHTFGVVYVVTIALAGGLSVGPGGGKHIRRIALAGAPALIAFACWFPFLIEQSATGQPYLWFGPPDLQTLLQALFSTPVAMAIAIVELAGLVAAARRLIAERRIALTVLIRSDGWQPCRFVCLIALGLTGFMLTSWMISVLGFPMFVPRYFTPQLIASFLLHAAFAELALWLVRDRFKQAAAIVLTLGPVALLASVLLSGDPVRQATPCVDEAGAPFERRFVRGDLPVVAESPHIFMPRATYETNGASYRFPLDWDVVMTYRERTRGNATDFHIMQNLKGWAGLSSIMSTDEIVRTMPHFLAIEHSSRAWFHNLRQTRDVTADKLAETTTADGTCTLWNVTSVRDRPS